MKGMTPGRSRLYPTTDFVYLVLSKNYSIWNSVQATTHKIRHGASVRKNPVLIPPRISQTTKFSPVGVPGAPVSNLDSQPLLDETTVNKHNLPMGTS